MGVNACLGLGFALRGGQRVPWFGGVTQTLVCGFNERSELCFEGSYRRDSAPEVQVIVSHCRWRCCVMVVVVMFAFTLSRGLGFALSWDG